MTYEEQKRISWEIVSHAIDVLSTRAEGCEDAAWEIAQTDPLFLRASTTKKGWLQVAEKMIAYRWAEKCKQARREADALISRQFAEECKQVYGD